MPICDLADWYIKVQPVIIHNCWYNKVYSCDFIWQKTKNIICFVLLPIHFCTFAITKNCLKSNPMQNTATGTVANSLPQNWASIPKPLL